MREQRWRVALHEAGHAVLSEMCGVLVDLVSIRPGRRHLGITFSGPFPRWSGDASLIAALPLPLVPADARRAIEVRVCISLAGDLAERLALLSTGFIPASEDEVAAERLARELTELSPRHAELLVEAEARTHFTADEEHALNDARALTSGEETPAYLALLRVITGRLVGLYGREIVAVAEALMERDVLTRDDVLAATKAAYPPITKEVAV